MAVVGGWLLKPSLVFPSGGISSSPAVKKGLSGSIRFKSITDFLKEKVDYDISFLWFKRAAVGRLEFLPDGDGYKAVLRAETKGFVGFFTSYRKHLYISHLTYLPEENRFRVSLFERHVIIKDREEKTFNYLDYEKGVYSWKDYKGGRLVEDKSEPIPEGQEYEDILSAFYNFRLGLYGPIQKGRDFQVRTMPEKGRSTIDVSIAGDEEAKKGRRFFGDSFDDRLVYVKVKVPKEIFNSKTGEVSILIDDKILPIHGIVEDYVGFGDVVGVLKKV